jgi:hypothetical protein
MEVEGVTYWVYRFRCQFHTEYCMAAFFDGREYQVKVMQPDLADLRADPNCARLFDDVHEGHVFDDGRLCLAPPANGETTLRAAYAKSVVWANGCSVMRAGHSFPFSRQG